MPLLILMTIATPVFVILSAFATARVTKRVWIAAALATVAFMLWSTSMPLNGWQAWSLIGDNREVAAVIAAVAGVGFGYIAEGVERRIPPGW